MCCGQLEKSKNVVGISTLNLSFENGSHNLWVKGVRGGIFKATLFKIKAHRKRGRRSRSAINLTYVIHRFLCKNTTVLAPYHNAIRIV